MIAQYEIEISEALEDAQFLGRIEMPEKEFETLLSIIASQLDGVMYPKARAGRLAQDYPAAVAYALVQVAAEEYAEAKYGHESRSGWEARRLRLRGSFVSVLRNANNATL